MCSLLMQPYDLSSSIFFPFYFPDDLSYLEHALEKICRPDLVTQIMDFREQLGNTDSNNQDISGPARKYKGTRKYTIIKMVFMI